MNKVGIITINYNSEDLLEKFIGCILKQTFSDWVIIIVNNSPGDDLIKGVINKFGDKRLMLLSINENIGYSKANNLGFKYLLDNKIINEDDTILVSNEDVVIRDKMLLEKSVKSIKDLKCSFLGPKIINNDGTFMFPHLKETNFLKCLLHMGNNGFVDKIFGINRSFKKMSSPIKVFLLNGACFFCRVSDFKKVGMFESNTFIYYEEEFLFRKVKKLNIDVVYDHTIEVYHEHSGSVKKSFNILKKKEFVYEGELNLLTKELKVNKFLLSLFKLERSIEFLLMRLLVGIKVLFGKNKQ